MRPKEEVLVSYSNSEFEERVKPSGSLFRRVVVSRSLLPLYWAMKIIALPIFLVSKVRRRKPPYTKLLLQAGMRGWDSIFFQEVLESAQEFFGTDRVAVSSIDRRKSFLAQLWSSITRHQVTHIFFDPRTASHRLAVAMVQASLANLCLLARGVTPIVFLTDASCRNWRMQSAIISSWTGLVVTCISAKEVAGIFPHRRIIGPVLMPLSTKTLHELEAARRDRPPGGPVTVRFVGSAYSPRIEWLTELQRVLATRGIHLELNTSKSITSNSDYWNLLVETDILVTTTMQVDGLPNYDWTWKPQVLFRFAEGLAAGAALVATDVPGLRRHLTADRDFAAYTSLSQCAAIVEGLVVDQDVRERLARRGQVRIAELVNSGIFWSQVDAALGRYSLT